jgi:hypothetical protein
VIDCPVCKNKIDEKVFYCPICGKKIKDKPVAMDFWHLVWLFTLCTLLPPLNLGLTMKYIKSTDTSAKKIGWISLSVMTLAILIGFWFAARWAQNLNDQVNKEMSKYLIGY